MANPTRIFENADPRSLDVKRDNLGRTYFSEHAETSRRAVRLGKLQLRVLKGHVRFDTPLDAISASMVLFDAIATRRNVVLALIASTKWYEWRKRVHLEWPGINGRIDRRILSSFTTKLLKDLPEEVSHRSAMESIMSAARTLYPGAADPLGAFLGDAQAWLLDALPGALLGQVLGTNPQAALPRSALVREVRKEALVLQAGTADGVGGEALGNALDAYFDAMTTAGSAWLVDKLVAICRRNTRLGEASDKHRMLLALLDLTHKARQSDAGSALILAWAIDLVESGTRLAPDIHPGTVESYVRLVAQALRNHFHGLDVGDLDSEGFAEMYRRIISGISDGQKRNARSALSSWHAFLMRWLNSPPLKESLYDPLDDVAPRANVIWPHEMDLIEEWLDHASMDDRLRGQLVVAFTIARHVRIRAGELFSLRLHNIQFIDGTLTVEVCPLIRDGSLKTPSARRTLVIDDHLSSRLILDWKECRKKEGALGEDLLFGDPHKPERVYLRGKFYVCINRFLKAVTGDRDVSLHSLSHTWISHRICAALVRTGSEIDIDRLDVIAVEAGHKTVQTSLDHYFHLFEEPIRHHLDVALAKIRLTSADAAQLSGVSATALRARASYRRADCQTVYWEAIRARTAFVLGRSVSDGIATSPAVRPAELSVRHPMRFADVLYALEDISGGKPLYVVASRSARGAGWAERVAQAAVEALRDLPAISQEQLGIRRGLTAIQACLALQKLAATPKAGIDFPRTSQPKFSGLVLHLERLCFEESTQVTLGAWRHCHSGRYLRLDNAVDAGRIFALLHGAKVPPDQLAISIQAEDPDHPAAQERMHEAELALYFTRCFGVPTMCNWTKKRGGRPDSFLIWSSGPLVAGSAPAGAATSIAGFNAIMLAALVCSIVRDGTDRYATSEKLTSREGRHA